MSRLFSQAFKSITGLVVRRRSPWPPTWPQQPELRQSSKRSGRPRRRRVEQGVSGRHGAHHRPGFGSGWSAVWSGLMSVPGISGVQLSDPMLPDRCCCWVLQSARPPPPCGRPVRPYWRAIPRRRMGPAWSRPKHRAGVGGLHHGGARLRRAGACRSGADRPRGAGRAAVLAGDSLGGAVGLQALLDAPDRIVAAVLLCTGAKIGDAEAGGNGPLGFAHRAPPS